MIKNIATTDRKAKSSRVEGAEKGIIATIYQIKTGDRKNCISR